MKTKKFSLNETLLLVGIIGILCAAIPARAQTNAPPPTFKNFPAQAMTWLTSVDTNKSWAGAKFVLGIGGDYENGEQWGNNIDAEYNIASTGGNAFAIGTRIRNAGIAGTVEMEEFKVGYCIDYFDLRVEAALFGGYDNEYECGVAEPQISIRKLMTWNTFLGIYIGEPILIGRNAPHAQQWVPNVGAETGCTLGSPIVNGQAMRFKTSVSHTLTAFRRLISPGTRL